MPVPPTFRSKWFWYSLVSALCFGGWALFGKLGSFEIPPRAMQFIGTFGVLPVAPALFIGRLIRVASNVRGTICAFGSGILSGIAGLAFYGAFRRGGNTPVITAVAALYPMVTVLLAVHILRERLTRDQIVGLGFAALAIILFSI